MKQFFYLLPLSFLLLGACQNSKQLAYFQDLTDTAHVKSVNLNPYQPIVLVPDDQVQITISSSAPEASQFFNLMTVTATPSVAGVMSQPTQALGNIYSVSPQGTVTLPLLGDIDVAGLTTQALKLKIGSMLKDYLKDVVVAVRLTNFKVTVIGDVTRPVVVPVQGERINVLEALGAAGDMTVFGKRYNVKVMRKNGDQMEVAFLNFNTSQAMQSPYFQLRQNDVVYVEPNKNKGMLGETWNIWVPVITSTISLMIIALTQFRY